MKKPNSLLLNAFKYSFSTVTSLFLFLLLIFAGRKLGADGFGKFSFAMAFVFLFDPLMDPGLFHYLIREIARKKEDATKLISHAMTWKAIAAPVIFLLIYGVVRSIHDSAEILRAVSLMAAAMFFKSVKDALRSALLSHELFGWDSISLILERLSLLIFGVVTLANGGGVLGLCWVFVLVRAVDLIVIFAFVQSKVCSVSIGFDFIFLKKMLLAAIPIGAFYITLNLYHYVDTVMISAIRADAEVGWYNASYRIYEGLLILPGIIGTVFMPRLSRLFKDDGDSFGTLFMNGLRYVFILSLAVMINGWLFSGVLIPFFFGTDYLRSIAVMNMHMAGVLFIFSLTYLQTAMITMDKQKSIIAMSGGGLFLNVIINAFLIPRFGYMGAASATVMVECLVLIVMLIYVQKRVLKLNWWKIFLKPLMALAIPSVLVIGILPSASLYLKAGVLNVGFVGFLFCMKVFDGKEVDSLLSMIPSRAKAARMP